MREVGRGPKVFEHAPVRGTWRRVEGPEDVLELMVSGADGVVAAVRDAGATFLSPVFHELAGVVCTEGTVHSHIGIVSREFKIPCVVPFTLTGAEPDDGAEVELDCSGAEGVLRA